MIKSPLNCVEQSLLKEWIGNMFDEITYITLDSKEKIKLGEGKDDRPDTYRLRFILQTKYQGELYKLIRLEDIDTMFNFNFGMVIGREYTKAELFDYNLFNKDKYICKTDYYKFFHKTIEELDRYKKGK